VLKTVIEIMVEIGME